LGVGILYTAEVILFMSPYLADYTYENHRAYFLL